MALKTQQQKVVLQWKEDEDDKGNGLRLDAIPGMSPQEMLNHYSMTYPEMATATIGEAKKGKDNIIVYPVTSTLGTKG